MISKLRNEIMSGNFESASTIIYENPNILNEFDKMGRTPLMEAVIFEKIDMCKLFIEKGANVNSKDINYWTPLHFAAQANSVQIAKLLIDNGALINEKDNNGNTPLFRALFNTNGKGDLIIFFLQNGADKNIINNHGVSPLSLAKQITNINLIQFFQ